MSIRFIIGRLSADPEVQQAGRIQITKFTVLENTYEYRGDERIEGRQPLAHYVEAKFELEASGRYKHWNTSIETLFIGDDESDCEIRATR